MTIRPQFQRAFLAWLHEARPNLTLQPRLISRTDKALVLCFCGIKPKHQVLVQRDPHDAVYEISMALLPDCGSQIQLYQHYIEMEAKPNGYVERDPTSAKSIVYQSREAAWRDLLFKPFLVWANEELARIGSVAAVMDESGDALIIQLQTQDG